MKTLENHVAAKKSRIKQDFATLAETECSVSSLGVQMCEKRRQQITHFEDSNPFQPMLLYFVLNRFHHYWHHLLHCKVFIRFVISN
ncbi:hypothetical protein EMCRGX_G018208 [Ephydatia muelleri]